MKISMACGIMWLCVAAVSAAPLTDSVRTWLGSGNREAWLEAMQELQAGPLWAQDTELPEPLGVAALPVSRRPQWAQVSDTLLWDWFSASKNVIFFRTDVLKEPPAVDLNPGEALDHYKKWRIFPWQIVAIVSGAILGLIAILGRRHLRHSHGVPVVPVGWSELFGAFWRNEWTAQASRDWVRFKNQILSKSAPIVDEKWTSLFTPSELELVGYIISDIPNEAASVYMSCTVSHIYNLRSSIRQKLKLSADKNLNMEIRQLFLDNSMPKGHRS